MVIKNRINPECITFSQMNLIFNSRIFWRRLTTWTRAYILSRYGGIGTAEDLFSRLFLESSEFGDMLHIIFGRENSEKYTQLINQYTIALRDLLSAQIDGDTEAVERNVERLYSNADERAAFLASINPYFDENEWRNLLETYAQYTIETANLFITKDYDKDIELYDRMKELTNRMGDIFAQGLYDYITSGQDFEQHNQVNVQCITYEQMNNIFQIRSFWFELATWIRTYMISRYTGIGNASEIFARLRQIPVEFVDTLKLIFDDKVPIDYLQLFYRYFDLIDALISAQLENNTEKIDQITRELYQVMDQRAEYISSLNPFWDVNEWRARLYEKLQNILMESVTFLNGDYAQNIDIFSRLLDQAESTSTYFATGLFNYLKSIEGAPSA